MGEYAIRMPDIGEGIAEAELVEWHVAVGDEVAVDGPLADVMTDKANVQIPSPVAGTVLSLGTAPGEMIAVGSELIRLDVAGRGNVRSNAAPAKPEPKEPEPKKPEAVDATTVDRSSKVLAAPAVRVRAREMGVDLAGVRGTGPEGRVTQADLQAHLGAAGSTADSDVPLTGVRRIIAQRMQQSWQRIPHITIVEEVDVTDLETLRTRLNTGDKPKLTVLPFVMLAVVRAVGEQPALNAHFDDEAEVITRFSAVHLGIATQGPDGLKVPVVRHAETLDLWQTAAALTEVTTLARDGTAAREQLRGSTITITSLGALGAIATTPIINRPEVAIVGVNRMVVRPLWNGSEFIPRTVMNLSSSFDHRIIDGWDTAVFVARLKELLETPALLFVPA